MSFFDEDDEPTRSQTAARPARPRPTSRATRPPAADQRTLMIRRGVAVGGALLFLLLAVFGLRSCLDTRRENALKDYNTRLGEIIRESDEQVAEPFFTRLNQGGESPQDLQSAVSSFRVAAENQLDQARDLDVPDEMAPAHESALMALEFRANGLGGIGQRIRPALGDEGERADTAIAGIAGQMQSFLASDVTWQGRVVPLIQGELNEQEIGGQRIANTRRFLQDLRWLQEGVVADRLGRSISGGTGGTGADREPAPGLHGTGLSAVSAGEVTLQPGAANRIAAGTETLTVRFANQGENDEFDVRVVMTIDPIEGGGRTITAQRTVDQIAQGAETSVALPINPQPAPGTAATISVEVRPVPGERKTDNNSQEYEAIFEG